MVTEKRLFQTVLFGAVITVGWLFWEKAELITKPDFGKYKDLPPRTFVVKVNKECKNMLSNLTVGAWTVLPGANVTAFDATYKSYWRQKGILNNMWREDGRCGYKNALPKLPGSEWPVVGSWCDKAGATPCCTNAHNGSCAAPSEMTCECKSCKDTRKYVYAELSKWKTRDPRCFWTSFNGSQACDVIHTSPYNDIHFVGDSLMRNMFAGFVMLLSDDPVRGAWGKQMTEKQKDLCVAERFFFWDECRQIVRTMDDLLQPEKLCGDSTPNFTATTHVFYTYTEIGHFRQLIYSLTGQKGSLVMIGIGMHMYLRASEVINKYLEPALKIRGDFYNNSNVPQNMRWPRFFFMLPPLVGLLKPLIHLRIQNNEAVANFAKEMRIYCEQHHIPVFDFRLLTRHVHSFDGTHYGLEVNLMKNQILLNHIAQESFQGNNSFSDDPR